MSEERDLASEYRKHARALRAAAGFDQQAKTSAILKRIAFEYEQMAQALEAVDEAHEDYMRNNGNGDRRRSV
jgi:hypothetical protein